MQFIALKELPQGQQPGERFDATEEMGNILVSVGAAKKADATEEATSRRRYQRRDLQADETA